jgi:energy-coupling factor transporter ATP-binding protein EcfA2
MATCRSSIAPPSRWTRTRRIGLIGRNGTGKSSLLAVIAGTVTLDGGDLRLGDGLRLALVEQEPTLPHAPTVRQSLLLRGHIPAIQDERDRWRAEARLGEFLHRLCATGFQLVALTQLPAPFVVRRAGFLPEPAEVLDRSCSTSRPTTSTSTASRSSRVPS